MFASVIITVSQHNFFALLVISHLLCPGISKRVCTLMQITPPSCVIIHLTPQLSYFFTNNTKKSSFLKLINYPPDLHRYLSYFNPFQLSLFFFHNRSSTIFLTSCFLRIYSIICLFLKAISQTSLSL